MRWDPRFLRQQFYALDRLEKVLSEENKKITQDLAQEFRKELIYNILTQKYAGGYEPLSKIQMEYKEKHGLPPDFWIQWGDLLKTISLRATPKGFSVGVERNVMPSRSSSFLKKHEDGSGPRTPVWKYFWYNEFGRGPFSAKGVSVSRQPARPVFVPTMKEFKAEFLVARREKAWQKIRSAWR